MARHISCRIR
jgi:hypothetical protein